MSFQYRYWEFARGRDLSWEAGEHGDIRTRGGGGWVGVGEGGDGGGFEGGGLVGEGWLGLV